MTVSFEQLVFRLAEQADVPFLLELRRRTMVPHLLAAGVVVSDDELRARVVDEFDCAQVILVGDRPVGLLKIVREDRVWHLLQVQLLPELQRCGIGTALVRNVIAEARLAGASVELDVLKGNPARKLYERLGFRVVREGARAYDMRLDAADGPVPPETLELARLRLRRPTLTDVDALFAIGSDPEVAHFANWPLSTSLDSTLERLRQRATDWASGAEYYWVITLARDDRAIGAIASCVETHTADFGNHLERRHWGHGYATEAGRAIVEWAFSVPSIRRVWATCDTENLASARVLEKVGLTREGTLRQAILRPNISSEPRDAFIYSKVR